MSDLEVYLWMFYWVYFCCFLGVVLVCTVIGINKWLDSCEKSVAVEEEDDNNAADEEEKERDADPEFDVHYGTCKYRKFY